MNIQASKKEISAIAALLIICFHLWIPVLSKIAIASEIEKFILTTAYIGVDIFFFISAYSMSQHSISNKDEYISFILNRAIKLMPLFLIALAFGHFLWFIPAVMFTYLIFPILHNLQKDKTSLYFIVLFVIWALLTYILFSIIGLNEKFGIFIFRIPIIILGAYANQIEEKINLKAECILALTLIAIGTPLIYKYGYMQKLNIPYQNTFYLVGLPSSVGVILLVNLLSRRIAIKGLAKIGQSTLELYFTQFVIGSVLLPIIFKIIGLKIITNLIVIGVCILIAILLSKLQTKLLSSIQSNICKK